MPSPPGRMIRPTPAVWAPAVARNSATLAAWFGPVSSTRIPSGIEIDKSLSTGAPLVDDLQGQPLIRKTPFILDDLDRGPRRIVRLIDRLHHGAEPSEDGGEGRQATGTG